MKPYVILMILLLVWILALLILKGWTRRRLRDIDGVYGTSRKDMNHPEGTVIGSLGEDKPQRIPMAWKNKKK